MYILCYTLYVDFARIVELFAFHYHLTEKKKRKIKTLMAIRMTLNARHRFPLVAIIKMPFQRAKKGKKKTLLVILSLPTSLLLRPLAIKVCLSTASTFPLAKDSSFSPSVRRHFLREPTISSYIYSFCEPPPLFCSFFILLFLFSS